MSPSTLDGPQLVVAVIREALKATLDEQARSVISAQDHQIHRLERMVEDQRIRIDTLNDAMHKRLEYLEGWMHAHRGQKAHPPGLLPDMLPQRKKKAKRKVRLK